MLRSLTLLFLLVLAVPAAADEIPTIRGEAGVTDGDTIRMARAIMRQHGKEQQVANIRIRLHGIDAPEKRQTCLDSNGSRWACGEAALRALADMVKSGEVTCRILDVDRYKRLIGVCATESIDDINAKLVGDGLALAYRQFSSDYVAAEAKAEAARAGLWSGTFDYPWDWRKAN